MTLSIEVLPAPFGPMMARISPLRISNDTSRNAFTPPNASDTASAASSTSPAAISYSVGALMRRLGLRAAPLRAAPSCRLLHCGRGRIRLDVPDRHARRDDALAAILERHLGGDVGL